MTQNDTFTLSALSRYVATTLFQEPPDVKFWGTWEPLVFNPDVTDQSYQIQNPDEGMRIDLISWKNYRDPSFWWVVCQANNISNPFVELRTIEAYAQTPNVIGQYNTLVFKAYAKRTGHQYNTGQVDGLEILVTATTLAVFKNGTQVEYFDDLSPYPTLPNSTEGNPKFWGNVASTYITVGWLSPYTLRPSEGGSREAPLPPNNRRYAFYGGVENPRRALRIPSQQTVQKVLSTS